MFGLKKKKFRDIDSTLLITLFLLIIYGLVVLYSAVNSLNGSYMKTQIIATIIGLFFVLVILSLDLRFIKKIYLPIYIFCNVLLYLVLLVGVGDEWGSRSWFSVGPINFQPAEIAKIGIIISVARFIEIHKDHINKPTVLLKVLAFSFFPVYLILRQPDTGTALTFVFFIGAMLFVAGLDLRYIFSVLLAGIVSLPFIYVRLAEFQKNRIRNFLDPTRDISNTGLQAWRGKVAIGSGRFWGQGFLQGTQSQFNFIPEKQTDYIYPVLVEEFGFIGGLALIILYTLLLYRSVIIAKETNDLFSRLIVVGFASLMLFHIFENIGMTLGLMPITGIPLPFFSYGGTFQILNLIGMAFILSVSIQKEPLSFR